MPPEYVLRTTELFISPIRSSVSIYSPHGGFIQAASETALTVLRGFDPSVKCADSAICGDLGGDISQPGRNIA